MTTQANIPADPHQVDESGFVWTFLDGADEPDQVLPGKVVVAGDPSDPFLARVVEIFERGTHHVVRLEVVGVPR